MKKKWKTRSNKVHGVEMEREVESNMEEGEEKRGKRRIRVNEQPMRSSQTKSQLKGRSQWMLRR